MQTRSPFFDELADIMTSAAGAAAGVGEEMKTIFRTQGDKFIAEMDLVSREEFDVQKAIIEKLAKDNAQLRAEIDAIKKASQKKPVKKS